MLAFIKFTVLLLYGDISKKAIGEIYEIFVTDYGLKYIYAYLGQN
jgi:hypothetical protein